MWINECGFIKDIRIIKKLGFKKSWGLFLNYLYIEIENKFLKLFMIYFKIFDIFVLFLRIVFFFKILFLICFWWLVTKVVFINGWFDRYMFYYLVIVGGKDRVYF